MKWGSQGWATCASCFSSLLKSIYPTRKISGVMGFIIFAPRAQFFKLGQGADFELRYCHTIFGAIGASLMCVIQKCV